MKENVTQLNISNSDSGEMKMKTTRMVVGWATERAAEERKLPKSRQSREDTLKEFAI